MDTVSPGASNGTRVERSRPTCRHLSPLSASATELELPYGATTVRAVTSARVTTVTAPVLPPPPPLASLLASALLAPIDSPPLESLVRPGDRVTIIVSDATRDEPRAAFLAAIRARLPSVRLTVAVATGTHGPAGSLAALSLSASDLAGATLVDHDGASSIVEAGVTRRGTPVRVHRCVVESDLVVATGVIRPHYFAGWGAGAKAIFPGLAESSAARINHRLKEHPSARPGAVDDNECRLDLEEAATLAAPRAFLLDGVADAHNTIRAAVAGSLVSAFRAGASLASPWCRVSAPRSSCIVVADHAPVTDSLYQASKLVASVAHLLLPGGTIVVVAPCPAGIGPIDTVNRAIYDIGLRPRLPSPHTILLVSSLPAATVSLSYARPSSLSAAISSATELLVIPTASKLILDALD